MDADLDKKIKTMQDRAMKSMSLDVDTEDVLRYGSIYHDIDTISKELSNIPFVMLENSNIVSDTLIDINDLLEYDDYEFAEMLYMNVLGRPVDRVGLIDTINAINFGVFNKIQMIENLANSEEGRRRGIKLTGYKNLSLSELLAYEDRDFIENAYNMILGRHSDSEGFEHYLTSLRNGIITPIEILYDLRFSDEGNKKNVNIEGLEQEYNELIKKRKVLSRPVIGKIVEKYRRIKGLDSKVSVLNYKNYLLKDNIEQIKHEMCRKIDREMNELRDTNTVLSTQIRDLVSQNIDANNRIYELERINEGLLQQIGLLDKNILINRNSINDHGKYVQSIMEIENFENEVTSSLKDLREYTANLGSNVGTLNEKMELNDAYNAQTAENIEQLEKHIQDIGDNVNKINEKMASNDTYNVQTADNIEKLEKYISDIGDNVNKINEKMALNDTYNAQAADNMERLEKYISDIGDNVNKINEKMALNDTYNTQTDQRMNKLEKYVSGIGDNVNEINDCLTNYDALYDEYKNNDQKNIQLLITEMCNIKSKVLNQSVSEPQPNNKGTSISTDVVERNEYSAIDYFDFENHFRGSREFIKKVQEIYLQYFEGKKHVLDLGCGRGEFTELLTDHSIGVTGVDQYAPYVEYMKMLGLPVVHGDAIEYLKTQDKVDGIFLGQVVEHISTGQIVEICKLAFKKLGAGDYLIIETPNPTSLAIYTESFYMDPSHQKPVHPQTLKYIAEKAGFTDVKILFTESSKMPYKIPQLNDEKGELKEFNEAMERISNLLYGSQDYSIIARK